MGADGFPFSTGLRPLPGQARKDRIADSGYGARRLKRRGRDRRQGVRSASPRSVRRHATSIHSAVTAAKRSEEHTSELQSLMRISYAVFCLKKKIIRTQLQ